MVKPLDAPVLYEVGLFKHPRIALGEGNCRDYGPAGVVDPSLKQKVDADLRKTCDPMVAQLLWRDKEQVVKQCGLIAFAIRASRGVQVGKWHELAVRCPIVDHSLVLDFGYQ
ncbi:hypothetical protein ACFVT9_12575 [Kitasatospora cineracea]|uniref:hypothetical protein n=1 Tax=Kitasatospora cineracea TaxID=88074 RepID=UPI0036D7E268